MKRLEIGWPRDSTWYKLLTDWGRLIAGSIGFLAAIFAVLMTRGIEKRKAKRELASVRRALGVEVRQYTWNALRAHCQCKAQIVGRTNGQIPAIFVEDKTKLLFPQVYPQAVTRIGDFGDCAANIVLFFNRVAVTREAAERLLCHPLANNLPSGEVGWAAEGMIEIAKLGATLLPFLKTGIATEDQPDAEVIKKIGEESADWFNRRGSFGVS